MASGMAVVWKQTRRSIIRPPSHGLCGKTHNLAMTEPDLSDLGAFVAVTRARGFRGAAALRGVSPSSLSEAMRRLEAQLDVRLLNRTTRSVTPTEAGQRLLDRISPALDDIAGALDTLNSFRDSPTGTLRLNVRFGSVDPAVKRSQTITLPDGEKMTLEPAQRVRYRLGLKNFDPCTILLNNDLSAGAPGILEELHEQYLLPPLQAGWSVRRKSRHFQCYEEVSKRFGKLLGIDPWLINPLFASCGEVDIREPSGGECLRTHVDALLTKVRRKYKEYGIGEKPFVVVKADQGTRGAGLLTVRS